MVERATRPRALDPAVWSPAVSVSTIRAAWWARLALRRARGELAAGGLAARVKPPPRLPLGSTRGVQFVLHRCPATCLERALVLQAWLAAHGEDREVVIGVDRVDGAFTAHAWLDFEELTGRALGHQEIHRFGPGRDA